MFEWISNFFSGLFSDLMEFLGDLVLSALEVFLDLISTIISAIPVPDFLQGVSLNTLFSAIDPSILFFISISGLDTGIAIYAAGWAFYFVRKFLTLFQW